MQWVKSGVDSSNVLGDQRSSLLCCTKVSREQNARSDRSIESRTMVHTLFVYSLYDEVPDVIFDTEECKKNICI